MLLILQSVLVHFCLGIVNALIDKRDRRSFLATQQQERAQKGPCKGQSAKGMALAVPGANSMAHLCTNPDGSEDWAVKAAACDQNLPPYAHATPLGAYSIPELAQQQLQYQQVSYTHANNNTNSITQLQHRNRQQQQQQQHFPQQQQLLQHHFDQQQGDGVGVVVCMRI